MWLKDLHPASSSVGMNSFTLRTANADADGSGSETDVRESAAADEQASRAAVNDVNDFGTEGHVSNASATAQKQAAIGSESAPREVAERLGHVGLQPRHHVAGRQAVPAHRSDNAFRPVRSTLSSANPGKRRVSESEPCN